MPTKKERAEMQKILKKVRQSPMAVAKERAYEEGHRQGYELALKEQAKTSVKAYADDSLERQRAVTAILSSAGQYLAECAKILMSEKGQL